MPRITAATVADHRAKQHAALLDAARDILATEGLAALTPAAVGARIGLARSSVYRYFASTADILAQLTEDAFPRWADRLRAAISDADAPARTSTGTPASAPTHLPSGSPIDTPTHTPTSSSASAPTHTSTGSPASAPTHTSTGSPASAPTHTPTGSPVNAPTHTPTDTPTRSLTGTPASAPAHTPTGSSITVPAGSPRRAGSLRARVRAYGRTALEFVGSPDYALIPALHAVGLSPECRKRVDELHGELVAPLAEALDEAGYDHCDLRAELAWGVLRAGVRRLMPDHPRGRASMTDAEVIEMTLDALDRVLS